MKKQNKWIAAIIGFLLPPLGMLYVSKVKLALIYLFVGFTISLTELYFQIRGDINWLEYFSFNYIVMFVSAYHGYKTANTTGGVYARPWYSKWYGLASIVVIFFATIFLFRSFVYEPYRVPAKSMFPTAKPGAYLIVKKWGYGNYGTYGINLFRTNPSNIIKRGELVVFEYPRKPDVSYFKRIIGFPTEKVEYKDKVLIINNIIIPHEFVEKSGGLDIFEENLFEIKYDIALISERKPLNNTYVVPDKHYFVLGDNRDKSNDSRYWGSLPEENIIGKVVYIFNRE